MGIWIGSAGLGYIISGITSFGIGHITASLASWRIIFLIWGAITTTWGIVLACLLPGSPLKARFLTDHERALAIDRVKSNNTGIENNTFKMKQFIEVLLDPKTWLLFVFAVASNSPNGGLTTVSRVRIGFMVVQLTDISTVSRSDYQRYWFLYSEDDLDSDALRCCSADCLPPGMVSRQRVITTTHRVTS